MRLTITKRKRYKRKQRQKVLIIVIILVPIISIILGYIVTKNFIIPYLDTKEPVTEQTQEKDETSKNNKTSLDGIDMYSVEIGRYKSLEEAKEFIKKLNEDEKVGYISQGQEYIVYTSLTLNRKQSELQGSLIKEKYPQAVGRSIQTGKKDIYIDSSEKSVFKNMQHTVTLLNDSYKNELDIWIKDIKDIDYDSLKQKIEDNNALLVKSVDKYSERFETQDIKSKDLIELYSTLDKSIKSRKEVSEEFNNKNIEYIRKTYYDFVESLFNYINYYKI